MSLQHKLYLKRAGILNESSNQLNEEWVQLVEESLEFDGSDVNYILKLQEEISDLLEALPKAAYVSAMRNATDPDNENQHHPDRIIARAAKHHGEKFAKDLKRGSEIMNFPRPNKDHVGRDKLKSRTPLRVTKGGKANKQDVSALKNRIKSGY
jgi:hypothetical protein